MAITYFRYDDANAPDVMAGDIRSVVQLIAVLLTTGYTGKPGAGWTIIFDDSQNNGNLIIQDSDGDNYVIRPYSYRDLEFGMCISADSAGTMVGYKSGNFGSGAGYRQRKTTIYNQYCERWFAFYDDIAGTLIFQGYDDSADDWNSARNSSSWDNQLGIYLGSLKPPVPSAFSPKVLFAGTSAQYNESESLFSSNLRNYVPKEGHSGTILKPYNDEILSGGEVAFVPVGVSGQNDYSAPNTTTGAPYIGLQAVNCYIARSMGNPGIEFIGSIRGFKFYPPWIRITSSAADTCARWIDPDAATYPTMVANPLNTGDGYHYYNSGNRDSQYAIVSDNPDWW